jgi:cytoskeleton protein RodZ
MRDDTSWSTDSNIPTGAAAVGQMLREAREALGMDLARVAEVTRIRQHFLEAIEAGRFTDLPGSAYAPAFLRGYAACVGLDVERVMQVYRSADKPALPAPVHHFPAVPVDRRVPRGAMMLASAFLLVCAYVTWHALTRDQMTQEARVPPVPQRLLADQKPAEPQVTQVTQAPPPGASVTATPPTPAAMPAPAPVTAAPAPAGPIPPAAVPPATTSADIPQPVSSGPAPAAAAVPLPAPPPVQPPVATATPPVTAPPAPPAPVEVRRSGQNTADSVEAADNDPTQGNRVASRPARPKPAPLPPSTAGSDAPPPQQATLPSLEAPRPAAQPRTISGPVASRARTVRAEVDSMLELRGAGGEVLATTYLRAGSTYTVPEHVGYVLSPARR